MAKKKVESPVPERSAGLPEVKYDEEHVTSVLMSVLDALLDRRLAVDFHGRTVPPAVAERLQQAERDGKLHAVPRF
jgi:hypothetical protein